eukprot:Gb_00593 [translate_table: standard]
MGQSSDSTRYGTVPTSSPGFSYISRARENATSAYAQRRPWRELFGRGAFGRPDSFADALGRSRKNLSYFRVNYALVVLGIVFLSLLWHPISLIVFIVLSIGWGFLYFFRDEPLVLFNRTFSDGFVLIALSIITFVALMLTHATLPFLIGLLVGVVIVLVHATFRVPDDLFMNEDEAAAGGLLSVVDSPAPSPARV